ncbi:MAG: hypothetical protein IJX80_01925 [Clostridia bacterium]|nr:hypothetical protein [Clostridia bacterium]
MIVVYYAGLFLCGAVTTFSQKKYSGILRSRTDILIYALTTGVMSMLFFWITSGFSIVLNGKTTLYSVIITGTSFVSYFAQLLVYRYMGVAEVSVITMGGKLLLSSVTGILLFSEKVSLISVTRIALMLLSVLLLFVQKRKVGKNTENDKSTRVQSVSVIGWLWCALIVGVGVIGTVTSKYIAIDPKVTNSDSLFFFANFLIVCLSVLFLLFESRGKLGTCVSQFRAVPGKQYLTVIIKTAAGVGTSLLGILILAESDVSLYVPLSNALQFLATQAVAVFILRERPLILPMIPATLSILLGFFG